MISGTKISQLPVLATFQDTDFVPVQRGSTTNRTSGLTIKDAALSAVRQTFPINYGSNLFTLSSANINFYTNNFTVSGTQVIEASSNTAALRITQTGTGNALVVEDSEYPDSTLFKITSSGQVVIGTASLSSTSEGNPICNIIAPQRALNVFRYNNDRTAGAIYVYKTRGTDYTKHTLLSSDDNILVISANASNGIDSYIEVGRMEIDMDPSGGLPTSTSQPSRIQFSTTTQSTTAATKRMTINHLGNLGIATETPNERLTVIGNISASNNVYANTLFANLSGNATTATTLSTSRLISLSGSINGNTSFNGSQNVTIFTTISTGAITDINIADNANISDVKLSPIVSDKKVSPTAIDYTSSLPGQVLMSTGSATIWQSLSSSEFQILPGSITTEMLGNQVVSTDKIVNGSITTAKLSANSVTTNNIADNAVTTPKIANGAVTIDKVLSYSAAVPNSLVSRDLSGNLSAVEVTANLKGNSTTSSRWLSSMSLQLLGEITGQVSFNGTQTALLTTFKTAQLPPWVVYRADVQNNLSGTFIQGTSSIPDDQIIVTTQATGTRISIATGSFTQQDQTIALSLTSLANIAEINTELLINSLFEGASLTAVFTNSPVLPLSGEYLIETITPETTGVDIEVSTNFSQTITSGNVQIFFNEIFSKDLHNLQAGHIVNIAFLSSVSLSGNTVTVPTSGIYTVIDVPNSETFILSSNITQSISGEVLLYRCAIRNSYRVQNVAYIDVGRHILNFEIPFNDQYHYTFTGSGTHPQLSSSLYMSSIEKPFWGIQDGLNLEIRSVLNNGSLSYYDFNRTNVICFGTYDPIT